MLRTSLLVAALVLLSLSPAAAGTSTGPTDKRLEQNVTLAMKATALSDVCDRLRADTKVTLAAGPSVADEKVTVFCEKMPLRELMRQLSRPFGYTWLRSATTDHRPPTTDTGKDGRDAGRSSVVEYRYTLEQDLRSQREEEALRSRARAAAVQALEREMERYRPYLKLSADEARARAKSAPPEEKKLLEVLADPDWGAIHLYFQLSSSQRAALLTGQTVSFDGEGSAGRGRLPAEVLRGTLASLEPWRAWQENGNWHLESDTAQAGGRPLAAIPEGRLLMALRVDEGELGQLRLSSSTAFFLATPRALMTKWEESLSAFNTHMTLTSTASEGPDTGVIHTSSLAMGKNPDGEEPQNAVVNAKHAGEAAMQGPVTMPRIRHRAAGVPPENGGAPRTLGGGSSDMERVTSADVLEALYQATGRPIVADFYTRLFPVGELTVARASLFEVLNRLADRLRLRWDEEGEWLQFRGLTFYDDRLQEVPNRLLARWQTSRKKHGALTLDDLTEIAQLADAQLNAHEMAQGAQSLWELAEWELAASRPLRPHLRYLATLSPAQRQQAASAEGLPIPRLSRAQQQALLRLALGSQFGKVEPTAAGVAAGTLRVEYTLPGGFRWQGAPAKDPDAASGRTPLPPLVHERTAAAALAAARRIDPGVTAERIGPTRLSLRVSYFLGTPREPRIERHVYPTSAFMDVSR